MPAADRIPFLATLENAADATGTRVKIDLHVARVGTVTSFKRDKNGQARCTFELAHETMLATGESVLQPPLQNVPVLFQEGDGVGIFFNLKKGDEVLAIVTDRQLDIWLEVGGTTPIDIARFHSLSDIVVITGIRSRKNISSVVPGPGTLYLGDVKDTTAHIRVDSTGAGTVTAEATAIKLGTTATLGAARVTDPTAADVSMALWIGAVSTYINTLAPGTVVPPTDFGLIASGSTKTVIQ